MIINVCLCTWCMRSEDSYEQGERVIYIERNNVVAVEVTENCCNKREISYWLRAREVDSRFLRIEGI